MIPMSVSGNRGIPAGILLTWFALTRALRPEGIEWPSYEDGSPCFKLERLTAANGITHESAHDALSDVFATIAMAKLVMTAQPKVCTDMYTSIG